MPTAMRVIALLLVLFPALLHAELSPSAYESMQNKAQEYVKIEVLRVDVEPGAAPEEQKVHVVAMVSNVVRTASDLKPDTIVNILYTITEHPKGWAGPGPIPLLNTKDNVVAYLNKLDTGEYRPAAGRMSFSNF